MEPNKPKLDSAKKPSFKILNADNIVKLASKLSNTNSKARLGSGNREREELRNESIWRIEIGMISGVLIGLLCVFSYFSISLEIVNTVILKFPNVHLFVDFKTILWTAKEGVVFKINPNANNCNYFPTLLRLQR